MSDKPWEDESLKGEYYKAKKFIAERKARKETEKKKPGLTDAFAPALEEEKRRKKFSRFSKLAEMLPGQTGK